MALSVNSEKSLRFPQLGVKQTYSEHRQAVENDPELTWSVLLVAARGRKMYSYGWVLVGFAVG
jgi:hypothetical protein